MTARTSAILTPKCKVICINYTTAPGGPYGSPGATPYGRNDDVWTKWQCSQADLFAGFRLVSGGLVDGFCRSDIGPVGYIEEYVEQLPGEGHVYLSAQIQQDARQRHSGKNISNTNETFNRQQEGCKKEPSRSKIHRPGDDIFGIGELRQGQAKGQRRHSTAQDNGNY